MTSDFETVKLPSQRGTLASLAPMSHEDIRLPFFKPAMSPLGSVRNPLLRPSRMIEHSRVYMAGDPIQTIDWRAYARTDQLLIRQIRDEATAKVVISVDLTSTMRWPPVNEDISNPAPKKMSPPTKAEIALRVALYLAYVHKSLGNTIELRMLTNDAEAFPSRVLLFTSITEIRQLYEFCMINKFEPSTLERHTRTQTFRDPPSCDIAYWIGDCLGRGDYTEFFRASVRGQLYHTLSSLETNIDWITPSTAYFDDLYNTKEFQGKLLHENQFYQKKLAAWMASIQEHFQKRGINYHQITDLTTIDSFLFMTTDFYKPRPIGV